jgi:hypothetical protein
MGRRLAVALRLELPLGLVARVALVAHVAARPHDGAQHVVRELHPAHVQALLDAQQAPVHQRRQRPGRGGSRREGLDDTLLGQALAEARLGEHFVLDEAAHPFGLVGERALVELVQDRVARAGEQVRGDLGATLGLAGVVELPAHEREQRRLHLGVA